jgi:hypothetical protein
MFTLKSVQIIHRSAPWMICTPLSVNVFVTFATFGIKLQSSFRNAQYIHFAPTVGVKTKALNDG